MKNEMVNYRQFVMKLICFQWNMVIAFDACGQKKSENWMKIVRTCVWMGVCVHLCVYAYVRTHAHLFGVYHVYDDFTARCVWFWMLAANYNIHTHTHICIQIFLLLYISLFRESRDCLSLAGPFSHNTASAGHIYSYYLVFMCKAHFDWIPNDFSLSW